MTSKTSASRAFLSWTVDVLSSTAVLVLLAAWIVDLQTPENPSYLSPSFVENGFCLSPHFDNTHAACSILDFACGTLCLLAVVAGKVPSSAVGSAAYFFAHGYGHHEVGRLGVHAAQEVSWLDTVVLATILSIGPIAMASSLVKANKMAQSKAYALAAVILASLVAIYNIYIKRPQYALLYINISIMLCISVPKMLMVGYQSEEDIRSRTSDFHWPSLFSGLFVTAVIICEPFCCEYFVASLGGHFVFDASLAMDVLVEMTRDQGKDSGKEKLKSKNE